MNMIQALEDLVLPGGRWYGALVAVASSCQETDQALQDRPGQPLSQLLPLQLFGHGSKRKHLRRLVAKAHCQASELIFLDNEFQHCQDAADFGSTAVFCPHGLTATCWSDSAAWRRRRDATHRSVTSGEGEL
ncbi:Magnesium-dependent phosphatase 1 [Durusdinium trenchii]|uniref:Magnesium-dependent phosphatase 1 n=1 Tax=Durusdinium trenchii TaxID=1381693 RepID=A0ABP0J5K7_9DINO